jgi:hypothetical protein
MPSRPAATTTSSTPVRSKNSCSRAQSRTLRVNRSKRCTTTASTCPLEMAAIIRIKPARPREPPPTPTSSKRSSTSSQPSYFIEPTNASQASRWASHEE